MIETIPDKELVEGLINDNADIIRYFFYEKCAPMFHRINQKGYDRKAKTNELAHELYLYLRENDWHKLRLFDYQVQLMTWTSTVTTRFFFKKQLGIMENESLEESFNEQIAEKCEEQIHQRLEAENLMNRLSNQRYRFVLQKLFLEDMVPQKLADEMGITVDNLYNIKQRAIRKLNHIVRNEA